MQVTEKVIIADAMVTELRVQDGDRNCTSAEFTSIDYDDSAVGDALIEKLSISGDLGLPIGQFVRITITPIENPRSDEWTLFG